MKRVSLLIAVLLLLCGCSDTNAEMDKALLLRRNLLEMNSCNFEVQILADYGDVTNSFRAACVADREGNVKFSVLEPDSIRGIAGVIHASGGKFTFSDTALAFPLLADGEVSPVSAPYLLMRSLMSGYISATVQEGAYLHVTVHDSYEENALTSEVWLNSDGIPARAEIVWQGRRVLSMDVSSFSIV